jgi:hypothetical protein
MAAFQFTFTTATNGVTVAFYTNNPVNLVVDWGDGTQTTYNGVGVQASHYYASSGAHLVTLVSGTINAMAFAQMGYTPASTPLLLTAVNTPVPTWLGIANGSYFFTGCSNCVSWAAGFLDKASAAMTNMTSMLSYMPQFNEPLALDTANVTNMSGLFAYDTLFNQPVPFNTSKVTTFYWTFYRCSSFNQEVNFDTSAATTLEQMLYRCLSFNRELTFNCASATTLYGMLRASTLFNSALNLSNTGNVTDMSYMLYGCTAYNQPLPFDTSALLSAVSMLYGCSSWNQDISGWNVTALANATSMMLSSGFAKANYDLLLLSWSAQAVKSGVTFHAGSAHYSAGAPTTARNHLTSVHTWSITDGGTP